MPRETFNNLGKEKKSRILEIALEEFGHHSFHQATVSEIVQRAGIPKGSFYQYFENKKDLYRYLIKMSQDKKLNFMRQTLEEMSDESVFQRLRRLYRAGFRFAKNNPKLVAIGQNLMKEKKELQQELLGVSLTRAEEFIEGMLQKGVQEDEIDPEANLSVAASMISRYNFYLVDSFLESPSAGEVKEFMGKIDEMMYILKEGLGKISEL